MTSTQIKELIERRRRQVLVHSVIYYKLNENLITDSQWSMWALELEELQNAYPDIAAECCLQTSSKDLSIPPGWTYHWRIHGLWLRQDIWSGFREINNRLYEGG